MKAAVSIRIDEELVQTVEYDSTVPIPDVGEEVVNPQTDGLVVKVLRRTFEYREGAVRITLDCE